MDDLSKLSPEDFVIAFMKKYRALLNNTARRYLIANRYSVEDILQYISTKMLIILRKRENSPNPIKDKERYFVRCISFYCIEYQRMNGFALCLPKQPTKGASEDDKIARSRQFRYIDNTMLDDPSLVTDPRKKDNKKISASRWRKLMSLLTEKEAKILDALFVRGLSLTAASEITGIAYSSCVSLRDRAYRKIFNFFSDNMDGEIHENIKNFIRSFDEADEDIPGEEEN